MDQALLQRLVFKINRKRVSNETVQSTVKDHKLHYLKYLSNIFLDFWTFWLFGKQGSIDKGHISWQLKRRASFVFVKKINKWGSFDLEKVIQKMTGRSSPSGVGTGLHDQDRGDGPTTTWFWEFITIMTSNRVPTKMWSSGAHGSIESPFDTDYINGFLFSNGGLKNSHPRFEVWGRDAIFARFYAISGKSREKGGGVNSVIVFS